MLEKLDAWIASAGPEAYVALGLASFIEYVFPPFPGDTVVVLGGIYAARGQKPWWLVFAVITLGSVIGAAIDYWLGLKIGERIERFPDRRLPFGLKHKKIHEAQERMRRVGPLLILINRFLPAVRGILFVAAGAARMPFGRVILLGAASAMGWNVLLIGLGLLVGGNAEKLEALLHNYQIAVGAVLGIIALTFAIRFVLRRRHRRSDQSPKSPPMSPPEPSKSSPASSKPSPSSSSDASTSEVSADAMAPWSAPPNPWKPPKI